MQSGSPTETDEEIMGFIDENRMPKESVTYRTKLL
jgi:hypothetical protein